MNIDIVKVTILKRAFGTDVIYLHISEELQQKVHGPTYEWMQGSLFRGEVAKGRGEEAVKALGLDVPVEVIREPGA